MKKIVVIILCLFLARATAGVQASKTLGAAPDANARPLEEDF